jgi:putative nucleotidyltransferase with HDIG domain
MIPMLEDFGELTARMGKAMQQHHPYTAGHQSRVSSLSGMLAERMELPPAEVHNVRVAGLLHDIGKVYIPEAVLNKPGKLSEDEFALVRDHPRVAYDILTAAGLKHPIPTYVLQHHERLDGSGYPDCATAPEILVGSQIIAVADVVEAMCSERPYRDHVPGLDEALSEVCRLRDTAFLGEVVDALLAVFAARLTPLR